MERTSALAPVPAQPFQFTIRSLLWQMVTVGMVLAFVRQANSLLIFYAILAGAAGIALAVILGRASRRIVDAIYWSLLSMSLALICLAGVKSNYLREPVLAWVVVGAVVGAIAGAIRPEVLYLKLPVCMAVGTVLMLAAAGPLHQWVDIPLATIISAVLAILSDLFTWARGRYHTSYGAWAASLVLAVILGNWGAAWFAPIFTDLLEMR